LRRKKSLSDKGSDEKDVSEIGLMFSLIRIGDTTFEKDDIKTFVLNVGESLIPTLYTKQIEVYTKKAANYLIVCGFLFKSITYLLTEQVPMSTLESYSF